MKLIHKILEWSEVWALLIPLAFLLRYKVNKKPMGPVSIYVWAALLINVAIVMIYHFKEPWHFPAELQSNNFLYNLHSVTRFFTFGLFFALLPQPLEKAKYILMAVFAGFILVNFIFFEDFFYYYSFSSLLLTAEAVILLIYCLHYYFIVISEEKPDKRHPYHFWVVTGLSIYVVVNFFVFLFYTNIVVINKFEKFAIDLWDMHNISYIVFCIFLAKAFYESKH